MGKTEGRLSREAASQAGADKGQGVGRGCPEWERRLLLDQEERNEGRRGARRSFPMASLFGVKASGPR